MIVIILPLFNFLFSAFLSKIETEINETILTYAILSIVNICLNCYTQNVMENYSTEMVLDFDKNQIEKYGKMDKKSKEKNNFGSFGEKLSRAKNIIFSRYTWGFSCMSSLLSSLVGFCYIIITHNQYHILASFFVFHGMWYYFVTKNMMNNIDTMRQKNREKKNKLYDIIHLLEVRFHNDECLSNDLLEKKKELILIERELNKYWSFLTAVQTIPNYAILILIALCVDKTLYMTLYLISNNLTSSMSSGLYFANQYNIQKTDMKNLEDFWIEKTFKKEYDNVNIPKNINITGILNNFLHVENINIKKGKKYLISGLSGSGKTTFIKGLIGDIDGLTFTDITDITDITDNECFQKEKVIYHGLNFRKQIMYMSQDVRSAIPTSKTTIRELFYNETNDQLIFDALNIVELGHWFANTLKNNLDLQINEAISGGQKTRLALSITLYKAKINNAKWLILDEPDAGLDPELTPRLLKNVLNHYKALTFFLVVHMCECRLAELKINEEWKVENNSIIVTKINSAI